MLRYFNEFPERSCFSLNGEWRFCPDRANIGMSEKWYADFPGNSKLLSIPGCWNTQLIDMFDFIGKGWFKKTFTCDECYLLLELGAVSGESRVWLDGVMIGCHYGGWTQFNCGCFVKAGEHSLVICADTTENPLNTIPLTRKDWFSYGGIFRDVTAMQLNAPYIDSVAFNYNLNVVTRSADIQCVVTVKDPFDGDYVTPVTLALDGDVIATGELSNGSITLKTTVNDLKLWNIGDGNLYELTVTTKDDKKVDRVGFRTVEAKNREILVNGRPIFIHGVNRHEEHPDWGFAVPDQLGKRDIEIIKNLNCNMVRGSHYPNSHRFVDELDRAGILFWSEIPMWGNSADSLADPLLCDRAENMITEMINCYRNHPSIIVWSMHNEVHTESPEGYSLSKRLHKVISDLDSSRLIAFATNHYPDDICLEFCDVICVNRYIGWYSDNIDEWGDYIRNMHTIAEQKGVGDKPIIMSEFGAGAIYGYDSFRNDRWTMSYQSDIVEAVITACAKTPGICGTLVWQFADIVSLKSVDRARGYNNKGLVDEYRRPKAAYFTVKKLYKDID